jgi:predicted nucleotidyltransferase
MRLSPFERDVIRLAAADVAGADARVSLFGSRTLADKRGGDIDLLVELPRPHPDRLIISLKMGARIEQQLGMQKIDILVADPDTPESPVLIAARRDAIPI